MERFKVVRRGSPGSMCLGGILRFAADGRRAGVLLSPTGDHSGVVTLTSDAPAAPDQRDGDFEDRSG